MTGLKTNRLGNRGVSGKVWQFKGVDFNIFWYDFILPCLVHVFLHYSRHGIIINPTTLFCVFPSTPNLYYYSQLTYNN